MPLVDSLSRSSAVSCARFLGRVSVCGCILLCVASCRRTIMSTTNDQGRDLWASIQSDEYLIAVFLAVERVLGTASDWYPYLQVTCPAVGSSNFGAAAGPLRHW